MSTAADNPERFSEPWWATALRTVGIALGIGLAVGLSRHRLVLVPVVTAVALWFTLGGHILEVWWRNGPRRRFHTRVSRLAARLVAWFVGGSALYAGALGTWLVTGHRAPAWPWWTGGAFYVAAELVMHVGLLALRQPSAYDGRG
jgi:hypothetical protein